ncbi:MAG TPA: ATP-binding cassette domain-containing protein, partial [Actinopolymorphaceae bacterium]
DKPALDDVSLDLPARSVVAVIGENGAGKSTMVQLLAALLRPTAGRVLVDGIDLATIDPAEWRTRLSAVFQDHTRPEFTVRHAIGIGDLARLDDPRAIAGASSRADTEHMITRMPRGIDQQLGSAWDEGIDLSGGQWQRLAVARGLMRPTPLVLVLDEPAASLDAAAEHALFNRYMREARATSRTRGTISVLVTHRFSTVRDADLILVLHDGRLVETGTHQDLVTRDDGLYHRLYRLHADSYR